MGKIGEILGRPGVRNAYHILVGTELRRNVKQSVNRLFHLPTIHPLLELAAATFGTGSSLSTLGFKIEQKNPNVMLTEAQKNAGGGNANNPPPPEPPQTSTKKSELETRLNETLSIKKSKWLIGAVYTAAIAVSVFPFPIVSGVLGMGLPLVLVAPLFHLAYHYYVMGKTNRAWVKVNKLITTQADKEELARLIANSQGKIDLNRIPLNQHDKEMIRTLLNTAKPTITPEEVQKIIGITYDESNPRDAVRLAKENRQKLGLALESTVLNNDQKTVVQKHINETLDPLISRMEKAPSKKQIFISDTGNKYEEVSEYQPRKGGMAYVFKVKDQKGQIFALKLFRLPEDVQKMGLERIKQLMGRFQDETNILKKLNEEVRHTSIPTFHDAKTVGDELFIVMEWIETPLRTLVGKKGLPPQEALKIFEPLVEVLAEAHEKKIYNLDIKVENILINGAGIPKLTDWGIAKDDRLPDRTTTGEVLGTLSHLPPEVFRKGRKEVEDKSKMDVYMVGMALYETLTGKLPFTLSEKENFKEHIEGKLIAKISKPVGMDERIFALIKSALNADPSQRPTARQMHEEIKKLLAGADGEKPNVAEVDTGDIIELNTDDVIIEEQLFGGNRDQFLQRLKKVARGAVEVPNKYAMINQISVRMEEFKDDGEIKAAADRALHFLTVYEDNKDKGEI